LVWDNGCTKDNLTPFSPTGGGSIDAEEMYEAMKALGADSSRLLL
jgi:hypothetical protein